MIEIFMNRGEPKVAAIEKMTSRSKFNKIRRKREISNKNKPDAFL